MKRTTYILLLLMLPLGLFAQMGDYRNDFSVGVSGGYNLSNVGFVPKVTQGKMPGYTGGVALRYVCEKYFSMVCSIYSEINYSQMGWREDIVDLESQPVFNEETQQYDQYEHRLNYIQIPLLAHLAWGKEHKGMNFFLNLGPQFGYMLSESTKTNFDMLSANMSDRANQVIAQDTMAVENKFDYGIAFGLGVEYSHPKLGHFLLEGRYYYGLGNIYGATKRDYFAKSNQSAIELKLSYLFDITRTSRKKK